MGAWSHEIMANDSALDMREIFTTYIKKEDSVYDAFDKMVEEYLAVASVWELLAMVNMGIGMGQLSKELQSKAIEAIDNELGDTTGWKEPDKRAKVLKGFKAYLETFEFGE